MSVQMTDAQAVTYTVDPEDSKGFPVADTITWSESSGGTVVTATPAADGLSCVFAAVAPGTATISATDGTLSASDSIDVTTGGVASLVLTPGAPAAE
jgi:Bacterial Ig-like domain (group 2)